jgi:hypothetical protein
MTRLGIAVHSAPLWCCATNGRTTVGSNQPLPIHIVYTGWVRNK